MSLPRNTFPMIARIVYLIHQGWIPIDWDTTTDKHDWAHPLSARRWSFENASAAQAQRDAGELPELDHYAPPTERLA